jgi:UDP-3-O-[3-hydroxymyristoyl] N-acetylglucosamine deacetylase
LTLKSTTHYTGVGIHTGETNTLTFHPAEPGTGILVRHNGVTFSPTAQSVVDTGRCTVIGSNDNPVRLATVEHLFSAIAGLGITDLLIETSGGPEVPIGDGSAQCWCELFLAAGLTNPFSFGVGIPLQKPIEIIGNNGAFIAAYPVYPATYKISTFTIAMHYDHPLIGTQLVRFEPRSPDAYFRQIAPARTFGLIEEVEQLQKMGLAKGGSLDNAIIVYPDHYSTPLRFENELARHKLLDLIGDLRLAGPLPIADYVAVKPGHRLNNTFARLLESH